MKPCSAFALFVFAVGLALGCVGCGPQPQSEPIPKADAPEVAAEVQEPSSSEGLITALIPTADAPVVVEAQGPSSCEELITALSDGGTFAEALRVDIVGESTLETDQAWPFEALTKDQLKVVSERELTEGVLTCEVDIFVNGEKRLEVNDWARTHHRFICDLTAAKQASLVVLESTTFDISERDDGQPPTYGDLVSFERDCDVDTDPFLGPGHDAFVWLCQTGRNQQSRHHSSEYEPERRWEDGSWDDGGGRERSALEAISVERGHPRFLTELHSSGWSDIWEDGGSLELTSGEILRTDRGGQTLLALTRRRSNYTEDCLCTESMTSVDLLIWSLQEGKTTEVFVHDLTFEDSQTCRDLEDCDPEMVSDDSRKSLEVSYAWEYSTDEAVTRIVLSLTESSDPEDVVGTQVLYDWQDGEFVETSRIVPEVEPELVDEPGMESDEKPAGEGSER